MAAEKMINVYLYTRYERFWHWLQMVLIFLLLTRFAEALDHLIEHLGQVADFTLTVDLQIHVEIALGDGRELLGQVIDEFTEVLFAHRVFPLRMRCARRAGARS